MSNLFVKLCSKYYFSCYYQIYYTFIKLTTKATWIERTPFQISNTQDRNNLDRRIYIYIFLINNRSILLHVMAYLHGPNLICTMLEYSIYKNNSYFHNIEYTNLVNDIINDFNEFFVNMNHHIRCRNFILISVVLR